MTGSEMQTASPPIFNIWINFFHRFYLFHKVRHDVWDVQYTVYTVQRVGSAGRPPFTDKHANRDKQAIITSNKIEVCRYYWNKNLTCGRSWKSIFEIGEKEINLLHCTTLRNSDPLGKGIAGQKSALTCYSIVHAIFRPQPHNTMHNMYKATTAKS